ncbi:MAG: TonB-dependent receptor [Opitutus sp.]|nr:TonB-dependent receptor [Opitutus sp.]
MKTQSVRINRALLWPFLAAGMISATGLKAATAPTDAGAQAALSLERFVVTGSAIPTIEGETFSPVAIYSPIEMLRLGAATPIEVVRHLPGFSGAVATEQRTNGGTGAAGVNLRGLAGTLTLFDGKRTAGFDNFNNIPLIALERIEVVKDGAGSIYGSDALSGVFNAIMVSRFEGSKVDFYYGNTSHGDSNVKRVGILTGHSVGRTNLVVAGEYFRRNELSSGDRSPSNQSDNRAKGGTNGGSPTFSGRATARVGSATAPVQDLVLAAGKTVGLTSADFVNFNASTATSDQMLNFRLYTPSIPADERSSVYTRVNHKFAGDRVEAYARIIFTRDRFYNGLAPSPMPGTGVAGVALRDANRLSPQIPIGFFIADNVNSPVGNVTNGVVPFRTIVLGPRAQIFTRKTYDFTTGLSGYLGQDWNWNVDYVYGALNRDQLQQGAPGRSKLVAHILDGSYNPWALDNAKGVGPTGKPFDNAASLADSAAKGNTAEKTTTRGFDFNASGTLFTLRGGAVKIGFGGDFYRTDFSSYPEAIFFSGDLLGLNASNPSISRSYGDGIFTELQIPLISPSMNVPMIRSLKILGGGRYDYQTVEGYSGGNVGTDIGRSFTAQNPKAGLQWNMSEVLLIRGTWGTGFRLPSLTQLFQARGASNPSLIDPLGFAIANQTQITTGGNSNLNPEKSKTYSMGFVFLPKAISGFSASADYYYGTIDGLVSEGAQYILDINAAGQGSGFVKGNVASINPNAPFASLITRTATGSVTTVFSSRYNISARETTGLDWALTYVWPRNEWGRFKSKIEGNSVLTWDLTPLPGRPSQSFLGKYIDTSQNAISPGSIPKHRGYLSQMWDKGNWTVVLSANYVHSLEDNPSFTQGNVLRTIEAWPTYDANVEYRFSGLSGWRRRLNDSTIRFGGSNVLDRDAPFAAGAFNDSYDVTTHSNRGRFLYVQLTKRL